MCISFIRSNKSLPLQKSENRVDTFYGIDPVFLIGPFRGGNKPPVLPGEEKGFSKAKNGELKADEVVAKN